VLTAFALQCHSLLTFVITVDLFLMAQSPRRSCTILGPHTPCPMPHVQHSIPHTQHSRAEALPDQSPQPYNPNPRAGAIRRPLPSTATTALPGPESTRASTHMPPFTEATRGGRLWTLSGVSECATSAQSVRASASRQVLSRDVASSRRALQIQSRCHFQIPSGGLHACLCSGRRMGPVRKAGPEVFLWRILQTMFRLAGQSWQRAEYDESRLICLETTIGYFN